MNKHLLLAFFLLFIGFTLSAQDKKWSIEINYPLIINDEFGSSNQGTIGAGIKYRFANLGKFRLGASMDVTWFTTVNSNDSEPTLEFEYRDVFLQPRIFAELPVISNNRLRLLGGLGWTWSRTALGPATFDEMGFIQLDLDWYNGLNLNLGLSYDVSSRVFIYTQYDLNLLSGKRKNRTTGFVKLGGGFRF